MNALEEVVEHQTAEYVIIEHRLCSPVGDRACEHDENGKQSMLAALEKANSAVLYGAEDQ